MDKLTIVWVKSDLKVISATFQPEPDQSGFLRLAGAGSGKAGHIREQDALAPLRDRRALPHRALLIRPGIPLLPKFTEVPRLL